MKAIRTGTPELLFWLTGLTLLFLSDPHQHHFSLCPLANAGLEHWCPGCGIGRSIALLLHGEFSRSFDMHWFGLPALVILLHRIFTLIRKRNKKELFNAKS
ncbi:DUF2752 domain-containing protein [Pedobacter yulinensis]|uniref:DUF2752 domain-containing protein n=1 Tax=Pedobacter yulinensis TaxID=2126353 RepID=A0A2T3HRF4_9SPHI|nr:DUF2752 domain-containing protein [Pedobacter yulinensis]PST85045.1 DUF2752 domain-containing protein [Pedobacter yulinensis]